MNLDIKSLKFDECGLIPAIVQDARTREVLTLAYMNAESLGAGEILLTSMDCDGTRNGYDIELTRAVSTSVRIPVIASGGAGKVEHFYDALTAGGASAVLAASLFHFGELSIGEVKNYLRRRGLEVR